MRRLIVAVVLCGIFAGAHGRGAVPVEVFDAQAMEGASVSTHVRQQADGRLLVSNMRGLFRYDGSRWQLHLHPQAMGGMEHLALDDEGRIHTSFNGDVGYWRDDARGELRWHSQLERLPADCRAVAAETASVHVDGARARVILTAATRVAFLPLDPASPARCFPIEKLTKSFLLGDDLLLQHAVPATLSRLLDGDVLQPVENLAAVTGVGFNDSLSHDGEHRLLNGNGQIATYREGRIALWSDQLRPLSPALTTVFDTFAALPDGRIAAAGRFDGVYLLTRDGSRHEHLDERAGVPVQRRTIGAFVDRFGDLWLAQERSIARVGAGSALTVYDERHGVPSASQIARWHGDLHVASRSGLFVQSANAADAFATPLPELAGLYGIAALSDEVLLATNGLLIAIRRSVDGRLSAERVPTSWPQIGVIEPSRFVPGRAYAGHAEGLLQIDQRTDGSVQVVDIGALKSPVHRIAEHDADTLWVADRVDGVLRVELDAPLAPRRYGVAEGLPAGTVRIFPGPRRAWFTTLQGLRVHDPASDRFVVPPGLPAELASDRLYSAYEDHEGHLWVRGGAILNDVFWREGDTWRIDRDLLHGVDPFPTIFGFVREGDIVWAIRANGLLRIDLARHRPTPPAAPPLLTRVADTRARMPLALDGLDALTPSVRDLRIDFALPFLRRGAATMYRSRLAGFEAWSDWTRSGEQARIYTNLPDGDYRFEVEARDALQREWRMQRAVLSIPAPWFRTPLALVSYALGLLMLLWLAMLFGGRWRQRQAQVREKELEAIVIARTEQLRASNLQLAEQAERLAEADRLKTRFFINVGHEFRTPLTLVLGPLEDLLRDARERLGDRVRNQLQLAQRNARRVLDLIVELLDVNRFEQGQLALKTGTHDLAALLERVAGESRALVERYGQVLQVERAGIEHAAALIDPLQFERCLTNLIGNAAKFSPRGTRIALLLGRADDAWTVAVRDQGRGIAPEALPHVFDRFFQADGGDRASGYGIGLSLVREIALAHGGEVSVSSELGVGSTFTLHVPASTAPRADATPAVVEPVPPDPGPYDVHVSIPHPAREKVLIVDDHDDLRERVRELLSHRFEVIEAADGDVAWQKARDELPDLLVSDVMMPGCDGVELTRRLRSHGDTQAIGVLLLTAKVGSEHAVAGLNAGANDYLAKPFDASELLARCEAIIAHSRRLQHRLAAAASIEPLEPIDTQDTRWRQRLDQHLAANLHDAEFGVEALAGRMHADRTQLFRKCKELLGVSPSDYLRDARLAYGHRLLEQAAGNVSEVAYASGFDSLSSFTRAFKARYGVPPSQVRGRAAS
jgi:signal transduction histidine kinase/DNA-binding response OmpR family regulator